MTDAELQTIMDSVPEPGWWCEKCHRHSVRCAPRLSALQVTYRDTCNYCGHAVARIWEDARHKLLDYVDELKKELDEARRERDEVLVAGDLSESFVDLAMDQVHASRDECAKLRTQVRTRGQHLSMLSAKLHEWNEAIRRAAKAIGYDWRSQPDYEATTGYPRGIFPGHVEKLIAWVREKGLDKLLPLSGEAWRTIRRAAWDFLRLDEDTPGEDNRITESRFREIVIEALRPVTEEPIWNKGTPMPEDYTCPCGIFVHTTRRNPEASHTSDCPYNKHGRPVTEDPITPADMVELDPESARILRDNLWDLYATTEANPCECPAEEKVAVKATETWAEMARRMADECEKMDWDINSGHGIRFASDLREKADEWDHKNLTQKEPSDERCGWTQEHFDQGAQQIREEEDDRILRQVCVPLEDTENKE